MTIVAAVILALAAAGAAAAYFVVFKEPGDISNPDVPFVDATPTPGPKAKKAKPQKPNTFRWPRYGYTKDHNRNFDPARPIRGPFRTKWKHKASALTEFPPAIAQGRILQFADDAHLVSRDLDTGKKRWDRTLGSLSASTPALEDGRVWVTRAGDLEGLGQGPGRVPALPRRQDPLVQDALQPQRVLPTGAQRATLLRHRERDALRAGREVGQAGLDLPRRRRDQGQPHPLRRRDPVLRRIRRLGPRGAGARRKEDLEQERGRRPARRQLLRHRGGRLGARVHRRHRRPRLLAVGQGRAHRLGAPDGPLRLLLRGRQERPGPRADGVLRLLRRRLLRARRALGQGPLDPSHGRQDLRRCDDHRRHGLHRGARPGRSRSV